MRVQVDESGQSSAPARIDYLALELADRRDPPVSDPDVSPEGRPVAG